MTTQRTLRHSVGTMLLASAVTIAAAMALPNCGNDTPVPNDTGGAGGNSGGGASAAGTAGASVGTGGGSGSTAGGAGGSHAGSGGGGGTSGSAGSGGKAGAGGASAGGGGSGGASGGGGSGGGGSGSMCGKATLTTNDAGHIPSDVSDLAALINGPNATTDPYPLKPTGGGGHTHTWIFTEDQVMTLRNGGMVTVMATATEQHGHMVTISCTKL